MSDVIVRNPVIAARELAPALRGHFSKRSPVPPDTSDNLSVEAIGVLEELHRHFNNAI